MQKQWVCIYCKSPNPYNARYCSSCNARIPDLKQSFLSEMKEYEKEKEGEAQEKEEEAFPIPHPGEMVGPLFELSDLVMSGEITSEQFVNSVGTSLENIAPAFESIYEGIEETGEDAEDYKETVISLIENVQFMFEKGLEEMMFYGEDKNPDHIRFGRTLAQRAELEYIQVLEMLRYDASINPFEGAPNVLGDLARRFYEGQIVLPAFMEEVNEFEKTAMNTLEVSKKLLTKGFQIAKKFDGVSQEVIEEAIAKITIAGDELSKLIVNLHTQEEIKGAMVEILDEESDPEIFEQLSEDME